MKNKRSYFVRLSWHEKNAVLFWKGCFKRMDCQGRQQANVAGNWRKSTSIAVGLFLRKSVRLQTFCQRKCRNRVSKERAGRAFWREKSLLVASSGAWSQGKTEMESLYWRTIRVIFILILYSFYTTFIQYSLHEQAILSLQQKFRHRKFLLLFVYMQMSAAEKINWARFRGTAMKNAILCCRECKMAK